MDGLILARIQFAMTIGYHFLFPSLTIGMSWLLVILEGIAFFRKDEGIGKLARYLGKIFVITFAIGVGTGLIMSFQFGTNWAPFSRLMSDVIGTMLVPEVIFAFFLESTFMGIYVFGRGRFPKALHLVSILLVALGVTLSAFWILAVNSWMHTPTGHEMVAGKAVLKEFWTAVWNHTTLVRFVHTVLSSMTVAAFFLLCAVSWMVLKNQESDTAKRVFGPALWSAAILSLLVIGAGHWSTVEVEKYQKAKFATFEAIGKSTNELGLILFAIPIKEPPYTMLKIEFPGIMNFLLATNNTYTITGLDNYPKEDRPPLEITFWAFHLMVYLGGLFVGAAALGLLLHFLKKLYSFKPLLWFFVFSVPLPVICIQLGWITTEVGRQPWLVQDLLRTRDAVSVIAPGQVLFSIILIGALELAFLLLYISLVVKTIRKGPSNTSEELKNG